MTFRLNRPIGPEFNHDLKDVLKTKKALDTLGHFATPDYGLTEFPDQPMFDAIKGFQRDHGLKEDGAMKPGGETAVRLGDLLAARNRRPGPHRIAEGEWDFERDGEEDPIIALLKESRRRKPVFYPTGDIGRGRRNRPADILAPRRALAWSGELPRHAALERTDADSEFLDAIGRFQKRAGVKADGWMGPGGETARALDETIAPKVAAHLKTLSSDGGERAASPAIIGGEGDDRLNDPLDGVAPFPRLDTRAGRERWKNDAALRERWRREAGDLILGSGRDLDAAAFQTRAENLGMNPGKAELLRDLREAGPEEADALRRRLFDVYGDRAGLEQGSANSALNGILDAADPAVRDQIIATELFRARDDLPDKYRGVDTGLGVLAGAGMARGVRARGASSQGLRITDPDAPFDEKAAARAFGLPADGRALATLRARQKADIGAFVDETMKGPKAAKGDIFYDRIDPDQARRIEPHLATYLGRDHNLKHAVRVIDRDAVRHILKEHGADRIPIKPDDIHHAPEVLRTGELVSVHQNDGKEVMILRRKLVDKNWLYVGESIRGSGLERIRRPTLSVKSMYWTEGPSQ